MDAEYLLAKFSETDGNPKKSLAKFRHNDDEAGWGGKSKKRAGKDRKGRTRFKMNLEHDT